MFKHKHAFGVTQITNSPVLFQVQFCILHAKGRRLKIKDHVSNIGHRKPPTSQWGIPLQDQNTAKPLGTTHRVSHCPWKEFLCQQPGLGNRTGNFCNTQKASTRPSSNLLSEREPKVHLNQQRPKHQQTGVYQLFRDSDSGWGIQLKSPHQAGRHSSSIPCPTPAQCCCKAPSAQAL